MLLDREEYVEQAYFFRTLRERMLQAVSTQDLIEAIRQEILATTKLPMGLGLHGPGAASYRRFRHGNAATGALLHAVSDLCGRRGRRGKAAGSISASPWRFSKRDAEYRGKGPSEQGVFLYQFETLCRNRLGYDKGLESIGGDPIYSDAWREWIKTVGRQIGLVDFADMIYVRSQHYARTRGTPEKPVLFGEKEGQIALANRRKDPLFLFSALQRHLGYPAVPRPKSGPADEVILPALQRHVDRLETRLKLLEEEIRGGINITRFYGPNKEGE